MSNQNTTPLHEPNSPSGLESISKFAQNVFTKQALENAGQFAKEKATELNTQAQDGDHSLRLLALLGGVIMVVIASMEFCGKILSFNIIGALIELYTFVTGIVVIILEGKSFFLSAGFVGRIHKYALFLKFLWGRGCLYFIIGTLQLYQIDMLNLISGCYMCFVGILFVLVGWKTANKLRSMRRTLYSAEALHTMFTQSDLDGDGSLSSQQFRTLTLSMGLDMTRRETEAAFAHMKKSNNEKLTYDEFNAWWTSADAEDNIDESAFAFV